MENKRNWRRRIAGLAIGLALCLGAGNMSAAASGSSAVTSDSIKAKEAEISQKKKEKEGLKDGLSDLRQIKKNLETQKENLKNYVKTLDDSLEQIERRIAELKNEISLKEEEILQTENELAAAQEKEENQMMLMSVHVRLVYETGTPSLVDMLLGAKSFGDFLNQVDYVEKMAAFDQQLWKEYKAAREYVQLCKDELELEKEILDETKASVEQEQKNLEELIEEKSNEITRYETDITNKEKAIREYEAEIKAQEDEIRLLEAAVAEERKKLIEQNRKALIYDGGVFKFPLATYTRISDDYGNRIHPTLGVEQFHNGVDFAAPGGTAIYAAYDGEVVAASYSATMGNYVMINHGDGLYTIYMHASALYVSRGDAVAKGTTIAAVGSTGRSTGNHLHFSVRLNGSYVSPWGYLSK
ncbi:MAG: peptidoglycan DD-metalloendopeptidase family protein [Lachnospiraceae bacterium]|jgi:murein DD-endopeptidase MepM/ murein hydrolase activator NlpD|nr:peptidoglycan DD-metalloendopeptidase family protein [Lachnospiraceae bacterium]